MPTKKIALFIDADNISPKFGKQILETLEDRGEIFIRRIYGNWEKPPLHGWNESILNFSLRAVQQPDFVTGKNATDMSLTIDAMDVLYDGKAEVFALVSNDSDFTPLVIRLREGGMNIIGLGNANASNAFRAACNEFIDLDALSKVHDTPTTVAPAEQESPAQISLFDAANAPAPAPKKSTTVTATATPKKSTTVTATATPKKSTTVTATATPKKSTTVTATATPKKSTTVTATATPKKSTTVTATATPKKSTTSKVVPINGGNPANLQTRLQTFHNALREAVTLYAQNDGFANLCTVGGHLSEKKLGFGVKNLGYGTLQKFLAAFPDRYELRKEENTVFLRCRTNKTQQTVEEGIAKLHDILRQTAAVRADENGFTDLSYVGNSIGKQKIGFGIRSLGYSNLQKFVAAFPDRYAIRKTQKKVFYRCLADVPQRSCLDSFDQLHDVLIRVAKIYAEEDGFVNIFRAADSIGQKKLSGELKDLTYAKLMKFVSDCPDRYFVNLRNGGFYYRCRDANDRNSADDKLSQLHAILREAAENHHDATGFSPLNQAGQELKRKKLGFGIRDFGYQQLRQFVADFPDLYEVTADEGNKKFRYRCKSS